MLAALAAARDAPDGLYRNPLGWKTPGDDSALPHGFSIVNALVDRGFLKIRLFKGLPGRQRMAITNAGLRALDDAEDVTNAQ
jgi:hypothetical protein